MMGTLLRTVLSDVEGLVSVSKVSLSGPRSRCLFVLVNDSFHILVLHRVREASRKLRIPFVNHVCRRIQTIVYGIEIGNDVALGHGVTFVHPIGTVVGGDAQVGDRVKFLGGNTVGTVHDDGCPVIEEGVVVGAGAKILGPIRVGKGARIGANAVVLRDVPDFATVVGVPARVKGTTT